MASFMATSESFDIVEDDLAFNAILLEFPDCTDAGSQRNLAHLHTEHCQLETKREELEERHRPSRKMIFKRQTQFPNHEKRVSILSQSEQRRDLEEQVHKAIKPYKYTSSKPPFSLPEFIVMAVVLNRWHKSRKGIHYWILQSFGYYRDLALINASNLGRYHDPKREEAMHLSEEINRAFMDFDAPLFRCQQENIHADDALLPPGRNLDTGRWTVQSPAAAKHFLRKHLVTAPAPAKDCRLMGLPVELRLRIYDFALLFPKSGVQIQERYSGQKRLFAFSKDYNKPNARFFGPGPSNRVSRSRGYCLPRRLNGPHISTHLALLSVSKQIYQEAMPVFFGDNLFVCKSTRDLHDLLFGATEERRNHIRHIAFSLIQDCKPFAAKTFKLLAALPRLRELDIWVHEESFKTEKKGLAGLPGFLLPGFAALRAMRGLQAVRFHGECDSVKKVLEAEMTKPKKEKKQTVVRKRKAVSSANRQDKLVKFM